MACTEVLLEVLGETRREPQPRVLLVAKGSTEDDPRGDSGADMPVIERRANGEPIRQYQRMLTERADRPDWPWLCFVCGLNLEGIDEEPWGPDGRDPTYNFCPCCGVEFGYGDFTIEAVHRWRRRWMDRGMDWDKPQLQPSNWNPEGQMTSIPERAR